MDLTTIKRFNAAAKESVGFYNADGEPRLNIEGVTETHIVDSAGDEIDLVQLLSATSPGGGSIVYTNAAGDFTATPTNGAKTITITGLPYTLEGKHVASIQKIAATTYVRSNIPLTNVSVSGGVITVADAPVNFATGDELVVVLLGPDKAYDNGLDTLLVTVQNPEYAHTTSVETLVDEADIVGSAATGDAGGDTDDIVDADGAFSVANHAVGYRAWQTADAQSALITAVDGATNISTDTLSGAATWASKAYRLPLVKRYEINMDTYNFLTLQYYLRNAASLNTYLLLYGTLNPAATVDSDTSWINISETHLGSATGINCPASTTLENIIILDTPQTMLKYMVKLVVECSIATAPDNDYEIYIKKSS